MDRDLVDQLSASLVSLGLRPQKVGEGQLMLGFRGENTSYHVVCTADQPLVRMVTLNLARVPGDRLDEAQRLVNYLNARRVRWGAFWIDPQDDTLALELAIIAPDGLSVNQVGFAMAALSVCDDYFPAFALVLWGGMTSQQALGILSNRATMSSEDESTSQDVVLDESVDGGAARDADDSLDEPGLEFTI